MFESDPRRNAQDAAPHLGQLLEDTLQQAKNLVQAELSLARRELASELAVALSSLLLLVVGVVLAQAGLCTLGVLLVLSLGVGYTSLAVVSASVVLGVSLAAHACRSLQKRKLPRTTARLALDAEQVLETVK